MNELAGVYTELWCVLRMSGSVTRADKQNASANITIQLPEDYMDFAARLQLAATRNSQLVPSDGKSLADENS